MLGHETTAALVRVVVMPISEKETVNVVFRGGPAFDNGKTRPLHASKCDGKEFVLSGGAVMGDPVPDRIYKFVDGEARFVRWA